MLLTYCSNLIIKDSWSLSYCLGVKDGRLYSELFAFALRTYGILCFGLCRFRDSASTVADNPSAKRYVITNPPDDFVLMTSDKVTFLLSTYASTKEPVTNAAGQTYIHLEQTDRQTDSTNKHLWQITPVSHWQLHYYMSASFVCNITCKMSLWQFLWWTYCLLCDI